jgi:hypothetical protein
MGTDAKKKNYNCQDTKHLQTAYGNSAIAGFNQAHHDNSNELMKTFVAITIFLLAIHAQTFATILTEIEAPHDNRDARLIVRDCAELKSLRAEYDDILETRICLLKNNEASVLFGQKLAQQPGDRVLPLFAESATVISGLTMTPDKRHTDFHAIGAIGYVELLYNTDGESIGDGVIYLRIDNKFVPFQSTNDLPKRLEWEAAKFASLKKWLNKHLPVVKDLGTVEVTNTPPGAISHGGGNRIILGGDKTCVIQIQPLTYSPEYLKMVPQAATNDYFSANLYLDSGNSDGQTKRLGSYASPKTIGFVVNGQFYRLTLKHK